MSRPAITALMALAISGCVSFPEAPVLDDPPPAASVPAPRPLPEREQPVEAAAATPGNPVSLTRDAALLTAVLNNRSLETARFGPEIAATFAPEERSAFDPSISASVLYEREKNELSSVQSFTFEPGGGSGAQSSLANAIERGDQSAVIEQITGALIQGLTAPEPQGFLDREASDGTVTISNRFATGTEVYLTAGITRTETNFTPEEYEGSWSIGFTQSLLQGRGRDVNLIAMRQARNREAQSWYELRRQVLDIAAAVEQAYWNLVLAEAVAEVRRFGVTLAEAQLKRNRDRFEAGTTVEADVFAAEAELATREADLEEALGVIRRSTVRLLRLMNPGGEANWDLALDPLDVPAVAPVELAPELSEQLALQYRPELQQNRLALANRELDVFRRDNQRLPRLNLMGEYGRTSLGRDFSGGYENWDDPDFDNYSVGLELDVQLLSRGQNARYRRAKLSQAEAEAIIADTEQQLAEAVRTAVIDVETEWSRIPATEKAVQSREEELRIQQDRFEVGLAENLDVLEVQRLLVQSKVDAVTAKVRYIQSLTNLYLAEGTLLHRRGIQLDQDV